MVPNPSRPARATRPARTLPAVWIRSSGRDRPLPGVWASIRDHSRGDDDREGEEADAGVWGEHALARAAKDAVGAPAFAGGSSRRRRPAGNGCRHGRNVVGVSEPVICALHPLLLRKKRQKNSWLTTETR